MKTAVIALTKNGSELALKLGQKLNADIFIKHKPIDCDSEKHDAAKRVQYIPEDFSGFIGELFNEYEALVFIMACGIVVRTIAPYIKHKSKDPAVVVLDEMGKFSISLLSGHLGGANRLAVNIAQLTAGTPVITTSTDVNGVAAFDLLAAENECVIENIADLKYISAQLVNGGKVGLVSDIPLKGDMPVNVVCQVNEEFSKLKNVVVITSKLDESTDDKKRLFLRPKNLILGLGCRRGTTKEEIAAAVSDFFSRNKRSIFSLNSIATIDLKQDEQGLLDYCSEKSIGLKIVNRESVKAVEDCFEGSNFVKDKVGVSSVAEPCAVLAGKNSRLLCGKHRYNGITLALAEEEKVFNL